MSRTSRSGSSTACSTPHLPRSATRAPRSPSPGTSSIPVAASLPNPLTPAATSSTMQPRPAQIPRPLSPPSSSPVPRPPSPSAASPAPASCTSCVPRIVFGAFLTLCIVFVGPSITQRGDTGVAMLYATLFFESICFPTIVALGMRGLGRHTKRGSGLIVAGVLGGACVPPLYRCRRRLAGHRPGHGGAALLLRRRLDLPPGCKLRACIPRCSGSV